MLDISLAGLVGAIVGTSVAAVVYYWAIGGLERWVRQRQTGAEDSLDISLPVLRRCVLAVDLLLFASMGYWVGDTLWG